MSNLLKNRVKISLVQSSVQKSEAGMVEPVWDWLELLDGLWEWVGPRVGLRERVGLLVWEGQLKREIARPPISPTELGPATVRGGPGRAMLLLLEYRPELASRPELEHLRPWLDGPAAMELSHYPLPQWSPSLPWW